MSHFKILDLPKFDNLFNELSLMINADILSWKNSNQICLNTTESQPNNFQLGCASLSYDWDKAVQTTKDGVLSINVPKKTTSVLETDFTTLCTQFKNTGFEKLYNCLTSNYNVGRVRLMKSDPKTCLSWHTDSTNRIHYPILTQDGCFMVIDEEVAHLKQDIWYFTETLGKHTAFNASLSSRIHIVACVL